MKAIRQRLLTNWHLMRIMRLGIGVMMLVMGLQSRDWALGLFSGFFLYQAITDTGCCGTRTCDAGAGSRNRGEVKNDTEYEEIK